MTDKVKNELIDLLKELENYMEDKADADYINEQPVSNEEMKFLLRIEEVRGKIERGMPGNWDHKIEQVAELVDAKG